VTICTRSTLALWHFKDIEQRLRADPLEAIEAGLSAHAFQAQAPRVYGLHGFGLG
jgi:hypothetical protein